MISEELPEYPPDACDWCGNRPPEHIVRENSFTKWLELCDECYDKFLLGEDNE